MNERDQAISTYEQAIAFIPAPLRGDTLLSPLRSWRELLAANLLNKDVSSNAERILALLEDHAGGKRS